MSRVDQQLKEATKMKAVWMESLVGTKLEHTQDFLRVLSE